MTTISGDTVSSDRPGLIKLEFDGFDSSLDAKLIALAEMCEGKWTGFEFDMVSDLRVIEFSFDKEDDESGFIEEVYELDRGVRLA